MNLKNWSPADVRGLRTFYDAGQVWPFAAIEAAGDAVTQALQNWLEDSPPPRRHPLLLPAFKPGKADPRWYAIGFSDAQAEALRAELTAFLGPVGSDYRGRLAVVDSHDAVDVAAFQWAGGPFTYRFDVIPGSRAVVRAAMERLQQVWRLRPNRPSFVYRTTTALLREFFTALTNNDPLASQRWLTEISQSGRLSVENLRFLEIERLGAHACWDELALHPQLSLLVAIRRPRRVTAFLIEALWHGELAHFLAETKPAEAVEYMRTRFLPRYEGLLRARGTLAQPLVITTFLLAAVAMVPPRREQIPVLLSELPAGTPEHEFALAVINCAAPNPAPAPAIDPVLEARQLVAAKDFDTAWTRALRLPVTTEVVEILLDCATELFTPDAAGVALDRFSRLSPDGRGGISRQRRYNQQREALERLVATAGQAAPSDWEAWLDVLAAEPSWAQALAVAQSAVGDWPIKPYRSNPSRSRRLAERLQTVSPEVTPTLRFALPHVAGFFLPDSVGESAFVPIYQSILLVLAVDEKFGGEDWPLAQNLGTAILETGPSAAVYAEAVDALTAIWLSRGEISRLDWALDELDYLTGSPALDAPARGEFFHAVWQSFNTYPRRIPAAHRELFKLLCQDLGRLADFEALPALPTDTPLATDLVDANMLRGKVVGIHTLTETAGVRAKAVIEQQFAAVDVRLNHDHVGTIRLESLAKEADYLLVVAKSAKHAATDFIKQKRPRTRSDIIYPSGKGSSSIVSALLRASDCEGLLRQM
jgi:hypothetical protein